MSHSTSSEPIERGWDTPWYWVRTKDFQASFPPSDGEDLDEVCNVDVFVTLQGGSRWTATVFTVAEVERLMKFWAGTDEVLCALCLFQACNAPPTQRSVASLQ